MMQRMNLALSLFLVVVCSFAVAEAVSVTHVDFAPAASLKTYGPNNIKKNGFCSEIVITFSLNPEAKLFDVDHAGLFSVRRTARFRTLYNQHAMMKNIPDISHEWPVTSAHNIDQTKLTELLSRPAEKYSEDSPDYQNVVCDDTNKKIVVTDCPGPTSQMVVSDPKFYPVLFHGEFTISLVYYASKADIPANGKTLAELTYETTSGKQSLTAAAYPAVVYEKAALKGPIHISAEPLPTYVEPIAKTPVTLEETDRQKKLQCWAHHLKNPTPPSAVPPPPPPPPQSASPPMLHKRSSGGSQKLVRSSSSEQLSPPSSPKKIE